MFVWEMERERESEDCGVSRELLGRARAIERVATLTVAPSSISDILRSRQAHRESERGGGLFGFVSFGLD